MEIQHVNIKVFAAQPAPDDLSAAIPVFHRWIQNNTAGELLIDVADYRHVPDGPGVMLIGHEAHYALDRSGGRLGLLYNRRTAESGANIEKLRQAHDAALSAARRLENEPEFRGRLQFLPGDIELIFNDRCLTPNTPETYAALKPAIESFFDALWGAGAYSIEHAGEPRERLRVKVTARDSHPLPA